MNKTSECFAFGRDFEKQMFNLKTKFDMKNAFSEGDKIAWSAIVNGKVVRLKGEVSSIVGETMYCIGKCVATGNWWRDYVSIHDKTVEIIDDTTRLCDVRL